jgi:hypothetical protein
VSPPLRGPGQWVDLGQDTIDGRPRVHPPGRLLDVATPLGFSIFVVSPGLFVMGAVLVLRHSAYHGVAIALASAVLFPVFCTGKPSELPLPPEVAPLDLIDWLLTDLGKDSDLVLGIIGRLPRGATLPDEVRLRIMPKKPVPGLRAIEVGVDSHDGPLGPFSLPFVIVRTLDGSSAADTLPKGLYVTRGRGVDERVAVLRPRVPTERMVSRLVRDLVRRLTIAAPKESTRGQSERSASSSAGKGSVTANAGTTSSPAHAT